MTFREWLDSLAPHRDQTAGEDLADSIALAVIVALLVAVVFM